MSRGIKIQSESIRVVSGTTLGAFPLTYFPFTGSGAVTVFRHLVRMIILSNTTDGYIIISFDGATQHLRLVPGQSLVLDITANKATNVDGFFLGMNQEIFASTSNFPGDTDPTTGFVTLSAFYALGDGSAE